ncbi:putative Ig domain-containing protein, partial [Thermomonas carbonis]|uniref:putative Ig domain-containing protein n=1 Tax=Thermomonas carbonis TaxID=1463158 RepID=UPI00167306BC
MITTMQRLGRRFALPAMLALFATFAFAPQALAHDAPHPIANTEGGSQVMAVSAGWYHTCGVKADGGATCWGWNGNGVSMPPAGVFLAISPSHSHSCGLKVDGSVACWGYNYYGQSTPPAGAFVAVSAGYYHTCGLKAEGSLACWGDNYYGESTPPAGAFVAVSAGQHHACGLKADGSLACWGNNADGQATPPAGAFVAVSGGGRHSCGVKADGGVSCWGRNAEGQATPPTGGFLGVSAGASHTCGVKSDGGTTCWGLNDNGQSTPPAGAFLTVSAGSAHTCGLKADGGVQCWGAGGPGTSGFPNLDQTTVPAMLESAGAAGFGQIAAGNAHACQVNRDGTLACWGNNDEGQATAPAGQFTQVVAGDSHSCAIGTDSKITCWGRNGAANTTSLSSYTSRQLAPAPDGALCSLSVGGFDPCFRGTASWSYSEFQFRNITHDRNNAFEGRPNLCGVSLAHAGAGYCNTGFDAPNTEATAGPWQRLESGLNHQCGLKANGSIECWGENLVDDQLTNLPASSDTFRTFSVGWNHACAIRDNGTLACWGSNLNGQAIPPAGSYVQVAAGNTFTCAIRSDGVRVCWGDDGQGQAPQLALSPGSIADGLVGSAHAGASFALADAGPNADGDYVPPSPVFYANPADLPPGLSLSAAGVLSGTPTSGGTYTFTVEGEDANGFTASREYTVTIAADTSPPVISYTLNGEVAPPATPDGENGWYISNVAVAWTTTDAESGIASSSGCTPSTLTGDATGATATCSATNGVGLETEVSTVPVNIDITDPVIQAAASPAANGAGWNNSNVTVSYTCSDATSGIAGACPANQTLSTEGIGIATTIQIVKDTAGNSGSSNVVMANIDRTAPVLAPTLPGLIL